uniref:serum paraoxonase/arylesterase 2-like isoform X2 n=1 Tax=Myxine glutinosa TaxID=7769 RepID=UPI00358EF2E1
MRNFTLSAGNEHLFHISAPLYWLDLNAEDPQPKAFSLSSGFDASNFNPHGISYFLEDQDDYSEGAHLFVVNHPFQKSQVEIFEIDFEFNMLMHQKTIKDELLHHVNDVVAITPTSFYGTNDHYSDGTMLFEVLLPLKLSDVVFYNSTTTVIVKTGFGFANGINMSPDGKYVYVSDMKTSEIHVFRKNEDFTLEPERIIALNTHPDNIEVDRTTGDLDWLFSRVMEARICSGCDLLRGPAYRKCLVIGTDSNISLCKQRFGATRNQFSCKTWPPLALGNHYSPHNALHFSRMSFVHLISIG